MKPVYPVCFKKISTYYTEKEIYSLQKLSFRKVGFAESMASLFIDELS